MALPKGLTPGLNLPPIPASAHDIITQFLSDWGLTSVAQWAWTKYVSLGGGQDAISAIQLELPQTKEYQARFPAIAAMRAAGVEPVTPATYVQYEQTLSQSLKSAGLPPAFWSPTAQHSTFNHLVTHLLSNNVSAVEANDRVQQGIAYMQQAPDAVKNAFSRIYGAQGAGALTALFLDPTYTLPTLQKMQQSAFTVGIGATQGIGDIGKTAGEHVAELGLSDAQVRQQLQSLGASGLAEGRQGEQISGDALVEGGFGTSAQQAARLDRIIQQRRASAAGLAGESFRPSTAAGVTSVGVAPT